MECVLETSAGVRDLHEAEKERDFLKTLWQFFTGTTGVMLAIVFCNLCLLGACVVLALGGMGGIIAIAGTPTP